MNDEAALLAQQADELRDALSRSEVLEGEGEFIAKCYAQALLNASDPAGESQEVLDHFRGVLALGSKDPRFQALLRSPIVAKDAKERLLVNVLGGNVNETLMKFLRVLARKGRLGLAREVHRQARALHEERNKRFRVEVSVARPLDEAQLEEVKAVAASLVGGTPILDVHVEPELIGGLVMRVGDDLYDRSVRTQLNRLLAKLLERKTHEIQDRRDRFRHSA